MKRKYLFVAATTVLFGIQTGYAQTDAKVPKAQQKPAAAQPKSKRAPFEPVLWKEGISPAEFLRNSPPKVFEWLEAQIKAVPGKPDQFSTREEREGYEKSLAEKMRMLGPIAFVLDCEKKYSADSQAFEVQASGHAINDFMLKDPNPQALKLRKMILERVNIKRDSYTGNNAYGASTAVRRQVLDEYVLAYPAGSDSEPISIVKSGHTPRSTPIPYSYDFVHYISSVPMLPVEAREKEKGIACLAAISLEPPFLFKFNERDMPTRSWPYERITTGFAFYGKLDHLWTVNRETGEVYSKHSRAGL